MTKRGKHTKNRMDLIGKNFGLWKILRINEKKTKQDKKTHWWCLCLGCEETYSVRGTELRAEKSKGCRKCSGLAPKTKNNYHILATERKVVWMGFELPKDVHAKTLWQCEYGHTWETGYNNIYQGSGCPHCLRKTSDDYHKLAEERGIKWLSHKLPKNTRTKTEWQCECGHPSWKTTYATIKSGCGCAYCAGVFPKTKEDYLTLAIECGLIWIGERLPKNVKAKTEWYLIDCRHTIKATHSNIRLRGPVCPKCSNQSPFRPGQVYLMLGIGRNLDGKHKIGLSGNLKSRKNDVKYGYNVDNVELLYAIYTSNMKELEDALHTRYEYYNIEGEWFNLPAREVGYMKMLSERETVEAEEIGRL